MGIQNKEAAFSKSRNNSISQRLKKQWLIQLFVLSGLTFLIIFKFIPMFGILMAFKHYSISSGIAGIFTSKWAGLDHFKEFFTDYKAWSIIKNTLAISVLKVIFSFPVPIILALMINEIRSPFMKRFTQTASYLPHFISWVIITGMAGAFFSDTRGVINILLTNIGLEHVSILTDSGSFWGLAVVSSVWKESGWWSIIFLASIAGIDPSLYEAASIDGASRLRRIFSITLPSMTGSIIVVLILTIGSLLGGGLVGSNFEQSMLLGNVMNNDKSEIIQTFAFRTGLANGRFDYATAIDLIQAVISVALIFSSNFIAKKVTKYGLF